MTVSWRADHDDAESVDDLTAKNVSKLRLERMGEEAYWLMFVVDGKEHHIDLYIHPGTAKPRRARSLKAFNRGDLPPARKP